jgi:probable phosphoglycerate mutase
MSTRLLLVRHGQIAANLEHRWHGSTDGDLTERGQREAARLADHLQRHRPTIAAVYTSPLLRARATATPIATALGVPLVVHPGLAEYGIGALENETFADLSSRHRFFEQAEADLAWAPPGGESLGAVGTRVVAAWRAIAESHPDADVVVVSHGAAIATGLAVLLHDDPRAWTRYVFRNTSVTEFLLEPAPQLVTLDVIDHLADG